LTKEYPAPSGPVAVVAGFNLHVRRGELLSIIGHSGCGKSTVLSMVAGLTSISEGGVVLDGHEIDGPGPDRGVVFQSPCLLPWMTAFDNVMLGVRQVYRRASREEMGQIATYFLHLVGLGDALAKYPRQLSAGMQQRVGIARAFALRPKLLLLDEPFGMLDSLTRMELQDVLLGLWQSNSITAVMVTHDVDEALFLSDRIVMMTSGPNAEVGGILDVGFRRPRRRGDLLDDPEYYVLRERLIGFLAGEDPKQQAA
jgi:nitrate ABC transporter ATP-binding subunit